jgi:hypothetical protein
MLEFGECRHSVSLLPTFAQVVQPDPPRLGSMFTRAYTVR